jgi:hypothetical protein
VYPGEEQSPLSWRTEPVEARISWELYNRFRDLEIEVNRLLKWLKSAKGEEPREGETFVDLVVRLMSPSSAPPVDT